MNPDESAIVLRTRRDLTGESFNDGTIDAWHQALTAWPLANVRTALVAAAREHQRVTVAHIVQRLPPIRSTPEQHLVRCELCDGQGWVMVEERDPLSPTATAFAKPCRCTAGRALQPTHRAMIEHSDRLRAQLGDDK